MMFSSTRDGPPNLYVQSWDGTDAPARLTRSDNPQYPQAIGLENGFAVFMEQRPGSNDVGFVRLRERRQRMETFACCSTGRTTSKPRPCRSTID